MNRYRLISVCIIMPVLLIGIFLYHVNADTDDASMGLCLQKAYPDYIAGIENNMIIWKDGTRMQFDDKKTDKTWLEILTAPDMQDQVSLVYPRSYTASFTPSKNYDPGRIRFEPFFKKMYGSTKQEVESNLVRIKWLPAVTNEIISVTKINGIDKKLAAISAELEKLPPEYYKYVTNIGGTYNYRTIKDTKRLSMHSFGIAIDMNVSNSEYWNWDYKDELDDITYRNRMPYIIAEIFEKYGFIWGGKWYHYDTMHFEYRPELLAEIE